MSLQLNLGFLFSRSPYTAKELLVQQSVTPIELAMQMKYSWSFL